MLLCAFQHEVSARWHLSQGRTSCKACQWSADARAALTAASAADLSKAMLPLLQAQY